MRENLSKLRGVLLVCLTSVAACGSDAVTGAASLVPARALPATATIDTTVAARILVPFLMVADGEVAFQIVATNRRSDTLIGGRCVSHIDARALGTDTWYDVTPATIACTREALSFTPNSNVTLSGQADREKLRAVAGQPQAAVFLRVRTVLNTSSGAMVGVQSAELPIAAP